MSTQHPGESWTLEELTSATGVTVRTVRYYIAEGLLPPPEGAGRGARYTAEHRDRLDIIASLKDRHQPLREIRRYLRDLAPEDIDRLARRAREGPSERQAGARTDAPPHAHDAMSLPEPLAEQENTVISAGAVAPPDSGSSSSALEYIRAIQESAPTHRSRHDGTDRRWHRLAITSEAELMVTEEVWQRRGEQLESLIAWARRVISEP